MPASVPAEPGRQTLPGLAGAVRLTPLPSRRFSRYRWATCASTSAVYMPAAGRLHKPAALELLNPVALGTGGACAGPGGGACSKAPPPHRRPEPVPRRGALVGLGPKKPAQPPHGPPPPSTSPRSRIPADG